MAGIAKEKNRISIDNTDQPYGGQVVDLQYSISFQGTSSISITIANSSGEYDTPIEILNSTKPVLIRFGISKMKMLATSYRKSKGAGGRTLNVNFEDMGLLYLDKTNVLLKHQHLEEARGGAAIVLGVLFADDKNGVSRRYFGDWKSGLVRVQYDVRDLADAIVSQGVPISEALYDYLVQFKAYTKGGEDVGAPTSFLRSEVGSLRSVLSAVANELGFVFFWNNEDGINEVAFTARVKNFKPNEGYLDFVRFENDVDFNDINATVETFADSCNVEDDSYEVSIKDSFLKGGVGYFDVIPPLALGKNDRFTRFEWQEKIQSTSNADNDPVNIKDNYDLELLMRAALMGGDFYKKYVLQKLAASYVKDNADLMDALSTQYTTMVNRNQPDLHPDFGSYVSRGIKVEAEEEFPLNIVPNSAVDNLYKGDKFELVPCIYSKYFEDLAPLQDGTWQDSYPEVRPPTNDAAGSDAKWTTVFDDDGFIKNLRPTFEYRGTTAEASEFVGVAYKATKEINDFIEDVENDPTYKQLTFLAQNFGTIYFRGTRSAGKLMTQELFNRRTYAEDVQWVFSDTATFDTPLGAIFSHTQSQTIDDSDDPSDSIYKNRGDYEIHKQGQSICGKPSNLPENVVSPDSRVYTIGIDNLNGITNPTTDQKEEAQGYVDIMGIYTFLGLSPDAIKASSGNPAATGCSAGQIEENEILSLYDVNFTSPAPVVGFVLETFARRSTTEIQFGDVDNPLDLNIGDRGKSISSQHYQQLQAYRTSCDLIQHPDEVAEDVEGDEDGITQFTYPTDLDYGVVIHDASLGGEVLGSDTDMSFSNYEKSNDMDATDLWYKKESLYMALEVVQWDVEKNFHTYWGKKDTDYWDAQLFDGVKMNVQFNNVPDRKTLSYSYSLNDMLQSVRASYVADQGASFDAVSQVDIEEIPFDIGSLLDIDDYKYEFPICSDDEDLDLVKATQNLYKIMENYVEANTSPSISRDFVVSGYGFKKTLSSSINLPSIYQGLESIGMQLNENGVQTTIKIGNKRRMRASAQLRAQLIAKGMPGATSSRQTPNQVNNSFATALQVKF